MRDSRSGHVEGSTLKDLASLSIRTLFCVSITFAQWSSDPGVPQLLGTGIQPQIAGTSDGGVYIAWLNDGNYHVYIQRIDAVGEIQFDGSGMLVSDNDNSSWIAVYHLNLAVDSDDNAIVTTVDERTGVWEVYAWKIAPDGSMLWGQDGLTLTTSGVTNMSPRMTVLQDNSVVVTCTHGNNTVLFQRISPDGELLWGDGILIETDNGSLVSPQPIVSVNGDVLVQWIRQTGSPPYYDSELFLQKYNIDGVPVWMVPIVVAGPVVFPMGNWSQELVTEANGGSFSSWTQFSGNVQNAVAQHITGEGAQNWVNGVDLSTNSSNFRISPMLTVAYETQELMAVWREANGSQSQHGVFAQRLDSNGDRLWGSNGTTIVAMNSSYDYLDLSVAGFGEEMISAYIQQSNNMNGDIYAIRLDADGNSVWTEGTVTVTNSGSPKSDMMTGKGTNCLFITWSENGSIYAHCLRDDGTLGAPDVSGGPGDVLLVPSDHATIQDAINASDDRDTILVAPGTYQENINYSGKNIVIGSYFLSYGLEYFIEQTVIDGNSNGSVVTFENGEDSTTVLTGFTIKNGNGSGIDGYEGRGGGIFCINSSPTLRKLTIDANQSETSGAGLWFGHSNSQLVDLVISNNVVIGEDVGAGGGISINYNSDLILENIIVAGNEAIYGAGIELWSYSKPMLQGVTITDNTGSYGSGLLLSSGCHLTLINSIIWGNSLQDLEIGFGGNPPDTVSIYCTLLAGGQDSIITHDNGTIYWGEGNIDADPLFCNTNSGDYTLAENSPCVGTGNNCATMGAFGVGCEAILSIDKDIIPLQFVLHQNYPNPFNPLTTLSYDLPEDALVHITIYDMMGRQVKTLINDQQTAGHTSLQWNATNNDGSPVPAGIYLYILQAGELKQAKKMVLLK